MPASHPETEIRIAQATDAAGIHALMQENLATRGGSLSASFSHAQILALITTMPSMIARRGDKIVGFLITSACTESQSIPILQAMLLAYPGRADAYVYGPVCVAAGQRGQGLAHAMFTELRAHLPGREGILFVRRDNLASLRAHARMGLQEVASFRFNESEHVVFAYIG